MPTLPFSPDELLTTTRSVRKRLDLTRPVPMELIRECLEIAIQAPSSGNSQLWHFVVVTDAAKRTQLADVYRKGATGYRDRTLGEGILRRPDPLRGLRQRRSMDSATYLAQHLHEVPVLVVPCLEWRSAEERAAPRFDRAASLYPAVWSFMLAARARGLGTVLTTLHLKFEQEAAAILGIPHDSVTQGGLIPVAYTLGTTFKPGPRQSLDSVLHIDGW